MAVFPRLNKCLYLLHLISLSCLASCAHQRILNEQQKIHAIEELQDRMLRVTPTFAAYSAEARLSYFGERGRVKATASLVVRSPHFFRFDLIGPHGGLMQSFSTNGIEITLLDLTNNRYLYGSATEENFDALLGLPPLGLSAPAWVDLFFGVVHVPSQAELSYDEKSSLYIAKWMVNDHIHMVYVDPISNYWQRVVVADAQGNALNEAKILARKENGLPDSLQLWARGVGDKTATEIEVHLRDIDTTGEYEDSVFILDPPDGVELERVGK